MIVTVTGEGGSGGALAVAVGDRVNMLEHAVYSVISPEGCASILWRDAGRAAEAATAMKITARDLRGIRGLLPDPTNPPSGCRFHPRCPIAKEKCSVDEPELRELRPDHFVACHYAEEFL